MKQSPSTPPQAAPSQPTSATFRRRLFHPATVVSLLVGAALAATLATRLDIDRAALWGTLRGANPFLLALAGAAYYTNFVFRGLRWRVLAANAVGPEKARALPSRRAFSEAVFLGWFVNALSWFRMGDPYRAYLLSRQGGLTYATGLGSLVAERVIDLVAFALLLAVAGALLWAGQPDLTTTVLAAAVAVAGGAVLALVGMAAFGEKLGKRLPGPAKGWYTLFHSGALGSFRRLPLLAFLSLAAWVAETSRLYLVALALGIDVGAAVAAFVALAHSFITALPLTPGGLGVAEAGMVGLLAIRLPLEAAASITIVDRAISYVSVIVLGAAAFVWREAVKRGRF